MSGYCRLIALTLACTIAQPALAEVYKTVDEDGNITYTDNPTAKEGKVEEVKLPAINTQPALKTKAEKPKKSDTGNGYKEVSILSPAQDATIPPGQLNVVVQVFMEPALQPGHRIQLFHNGQPYGEAAYATSFSIDELIRGEHNVQVRVIDTKGNSVATSDKVTFFVKRASRLNKEAIQTQKSDRAKRVQKATQGSK
ncbi:DUF4124 domain-containing protein [Porticoccus sp.]|nr:MAG: DUF4124 domain-containing protein [Gammaproteobacteria bacterium]